MDKRSPPTSVTRVRFPYSASHVGFLLVLSLPRGFFSGFSGFPPSPKTNTSKFQFNFEVERLKYEPLAQETGQPVPTVLDVK